MYALSISKNYLDLFFQNKRIGCRGENNFLKTLEPFEHTSNICEYEEKSKTFAAIFCEWYTTYKWDHINEDHKKLWSGNFFT